MRLLLFIIVILLTRYGFSQEVYLNDDVEVIPRDAVSRSLWIINERLHTNLYVAGTSHLGCQDDSITIRRVTVQQWLDGGFDLFGPPTGFAQSCAPLNSGIAIVFGPNLIGDRPIEPRILEHETIHALGMWNHINDPNALLYGEPFSCCFSAITMTQDDTLSAAQFTHTQPDACFAELLDNLDVMIPNIQGYQAVLRYQGLRDGMMAWTADVVVNPLQQCHGFSVSDGRAILPDVRAFNGGRWMASLEARNGVWVLVSLTML